MDPKQLSPHNEGLTAVKQLKEGILSLKSAMAIDDEWKSTSDPEAMTEHTFHRQLIRAVKGTY